MELPRILVVDDDPLMKELVAVALGDSCEVRTAESGADALALLGRERVDLVVLDVDMPELNGYETCRRLRASESGAALPVIFLSGCAGIEERLEGYAAGGNDYMVKPGEAAELRAKVALALRERQSHKELAAQLDEMTNAALTSADMMGDAAVVLDFQRQLAQHGSYEEVAGSVLETLARFSLEGCVRLMGARTVTRNARGAASALEGSILDHLARAPGDNSVFAIGANVGLRLPHLLMFVRGLLISRPADMPREVAERMGRHIDNVAIVAEGANMQVQALDARQAAMQLEGSRRLVQLTREALTDVCARDLEQRRAVRDIFERLTSVVEETFISLGLTSTQEDLLAGVIRDHGAHVEQVLDSGREVQERLTRIIRQLETPA